MNDKKKKEFAEWSKSVRTRWKKQFNAEPFTPNLSVLTSPLQERMMRCAIEARYFDITDENRDDLVILAHHTLLIDDIKFKSNINDRRRIYGFNEKEHDATI